MGLFKCPDFFVGHFELAVLIVTIFVVLEFFVVFIIIRPQIALWLTDIALVRQDDHAHIRPTVLFHFLQPAVDILKGLPIRKVKNNHDSVCVLIIRLGYGSVSLLASRIPNLKPDRAFVYLQSPKPEIDSDCGYIIFLELIILNNKDTSEMQLNVIVKALTANLTSRHDLPVQESPIKTNLKK